MARPAIRTTPNLGSQPLRGADFERAHSSVVLGENVRDRRRGFTIVELLIVIVVIAILAAITIVAYNGVNNRAKASAASSAAQQAAKKVMAYAVTNAEQYPAALSDAGVSDSGSTSYQYRVDNTATPKTFCLTVTSQNVSYFVSSAAPTPSAGACAGHDMNGVAAITNVVRNPTADSTVTGWTSRTASSVSAASTGTIRGPQSVRMTATGAGPSVIVNAPGGPYPIAATPGISFTASIAVRPEDVATQVRLVMESFNGTTFISGSAVNGAVVTAAVGETVRPTVTGTIAATANRVQVYVLITSTAVSGNRWLLDDAIVTEGSDVRSYADGDSTGWIWNGPASSSTSTGVAL